MFQIDGLPSERRNLTRGLVAKKTYLHIHIMSFWDFGTKLIITKQHIDQIKIYDQTRLDTSISISHNYG